MQLGRVIGTVWATRKDERLAGLRLLIVAEVDIDRAPTGAHVIAVDAVEAGVGELVLLAKGSSARQTQVTDNKPVDAVIIASVDNLEYTDLDVLEEAYRERREAVDARLAAVRED